VTVNIGAIDAGGPANVVPDLAICRINIRITEANDEQAAIEAVRKIIAELNSHGGIAAELQGQLRHRRKSGRTHASSLDAIVACGRDLGLKLATRASAAPRMEIAWLPRDCPTSTPWAFAATESTARMNTCSWIAWSNAPQLTTLLLLKIAAGDIDPAPFCR